jgi:16S rRNA (guanine1207-N2)-methyltransferase
MVQLRLPDLSAELVTASGVFAAQRVDRGTLALLRQAPAPAPCTSAVDLGAGYGPIAVTLARREPRAGVWAVDVNERALELVRVNADRVGTANVIAAGPADLPPALRFDGLYSNPPIKIGRGELHELLERWLGRLIAGGSAWLVVKRAMGSDSLHGWLNPPWSTWRASAGELRSSTSSRCSRRRRTRSTGARTSPGD